MVQTVPKQYRLISITCYWGSFSAKCIEASVASLWPWDVYVCVRVHVHKYIFLLWFFSVRSLKCEGSVADWCSYKMILRVSAVCLHVFMYYAACWEPNLSQQAAVPGINYPQNCSWLLVYGAPFFALEKWTNIWAVCIIVGLSDLRNPLQPHETNANFLFLIVGLNDCWTQLSLLSWADLLLMKNSLFS